MTWADYWAPNLTSWLLGGAISAVASVIVGILVRRWLRQILGQQLETGRHAEQGAISASQTAQSVSAMQTGQADVVRRLRGLEGRVEGLGDAISASLGHRARDDLRFRDLEQRLEGLRLNDLQGNP